MLELVSAETWAALRNYSGSYVLVSEGRIWPVLVLY